MFSSILTFLIAWYNLPFSLLMALGMLIAALQVFGLSHDGDGDADADADLDHDLDVDHDASLDHDADGDADGDTDTDGDGQPDSLSGFSWLAYIGVGKTPLLVVLLIFLLSIGMLGWLLNGVIVSVFGGFPGLMILLSAPLSFVAGSLLTSRLTRLIGNALPPVSSTAARAQALVGKIGKVTSPYVDEKYGLIHLRDEGHTLISQFAVSEDETPIKRGEEVILLSYDTERKRYLVTRR